MAQKIYFDSVNNKHIVDLSGIKNEESIKSEFSLDVSTQILSVDPLLNEGHEIISNTLQKFDIQTRASAEQQTIETDRQAKENAIKTKLDLTNQEFQDLKTALQ